MSSHHEGPGRWLLGRYVGATSSPASRRRVEGHYAARSIYGSIVVLALLLALEEHPPTPGRAAVMVVVSVFAVLAAEAYAENLGEELDLGRRLTRGERFERLRQLSAVMVAAEVPVVFLLLAAVGVLEAPTGFRLARWSCLLLLLAAGYLARRLAGSSRGAAAGSGLLVFGAGLLLAVVKSLAHG